MSNFRVGQKVECIRGSKWSQCPVIKGQVYRISRIGLFHGVLHVDVEGVEYEEPLAWRIDRFRPVVTRQTDIEVFRRLLVPRKEPVS